MEKKMSDRDKFIVIIAIIVPIIGAMYTTDKRMNKPKPNIKLSDIQHEKNIRLVLKKLQNISYRHINTDDKININPKQPLQSLAAMKNTSLKLHKIFSELSQVDLESSFKKVETIEEFRELKELIEKNCKTREKILSEHIDALELTSNGTVSSDKGYLMTQRTNRKVDAYNQSVIEEGKTILGIAHKYNLKYNKNGFIL